jgi:hypothetical protein
MSAPSAEPRRAGGAGAIILIAAGLMICAGLAAFLIITRGGRVDGAAVLERAFGVRGMGERYAIVEAREMPGGTEVVILDDPSVPVEAPPAMEQPAPDERVDWRTVVIPAATAWPRRIVFTFPKPGNEQAVIEAFMTHGQWGDIAHLGPNGGKVIVAAKKIAWRGFDADWVHERAYERKLSFRDALSVNLSLPNQPCVMTAFWPKGEAASEAKLAELLVLLNSSNEK